MKIETEASDLSELISHALKLATGDATHPGFGLGLFEVTSKGAVRITVMNAQAGCRVFLPPSEGAFEPGKIGMPLTSLKAIASILSDGTAGLSLHGPVLRIRSGGTILKLQHMPADACIPFPMPSESAPVTEVDTDVFHDAAKRVSWCVAPSSDTARSNLQGVHIHPGYVEAADGHRLVCLDKGLLGAMDIVVPAALFSIVSSMTRYGGKVIKAAEHGGKIYLSSNRWVVFCRLMDGKYPPTGSLYYTPDEKGFATTNDKGTHPVSEISFERSSMSDASSKMSAMFQVSSGSSRPIMRFMHKDGRLFAVMRGKGDGGGDIACEIPYKKTIENDGFAELNKIILDATYIGNAMDTAMVDGEVKMMWTNALSRVQFTQGDVRALVMPRSAE